jgi:hypothetical protein
MYDKCNKTAWFDEPGGKGKFCGKHYENNMVNIKNIRCEHDDCKLQPCFDEPGGKGIYCKKHKTATMINVKNKICIYEGCECSRPRFDEPGGKGIYCKTHKTDTMVDVCNKKCGYDGCNIRPNYDEPGGKGKFCKTHKTDIMIDIKSKKCIHEGCNSTNPVFGESGVKGRFCKIHKTDTMIDIKNKKCLYEGCNKQPLYDEIGGKGKFCKTHKTDTMIDVIHKRCTYEECNSLNPVFDEPGGKGKFCSIHKTSNMIDVRNNKCVHEGCGKHAIFDELGGKGKFCSSHKTNIMIDIRSKRCIHCSSRASFGKPGIPISHCAKHRLPGMIRLPTRKCKTKNCKQIALYGINYIANHCENHKTDEEYNLIERECKSCHLTFILDNNNICEFCNPDTFKISRLAKQTAVFNYLDQRKELPEPKSTDTMIEGGECGKERPDRVYDFGDKIIIIECDEHQHKNRQCDCEQTRMVNIGQSFGGIPVYFIRWNPDDYSPANAKKEPEIVSKRHILLGDLLRDINNEKYILPNALVSAIYLYYNNWSNLYNEQWNILTSFTNI